LRRAQGTTRETGREMSNMHEQVGLGADEGARAAADPGPMPWAVQRIRRQLYWQATFALVRATFGLLVILLVGVSFASLGGIISAGVFAAGVAVAGASIVLARRVRSQRQSTRTAILYLEAVVGVVYALLTLFASNGGGIAGIAFNGAGLLIAGSVFRHSLADDAVTWFGIH